jgi:hypothetical protein
MYLFILSLTYIIFLINLDVWRPICQCCIETILFPSLPNAVAMGADLLTGVAGWVERSAHVRKDVESLLPERGRVKSKVKRTAAQLSADEFSARAAKHGFRLTSTQTDCIEPWKRKYRTARITLAVFSLEANNKADSTFSLIFRRSIHHLTKTEREESRLVYRLSSSPFFWRYQLQTSTGLQAILTELYRVSSVCPGNFWDSTLKSITAAPFQMLLHTHHSWQYILISQLYATSTARTTSLNNKNSCS